MTLPARPPVPCRPEEITATVAPDGRSITFQPCGLTSYHPSDVLNRYCGFCHRFMALVEFARELRWDRCPPQPDA